MRWQLEQEPVIAVSGGQMSLAQLQEMAARQQRQIAAQQQLLVTKEQRLRHIRQQQQRSIDGDAAAAANVRRAQERVDAHERTLHRLRVLRGQTDTQRTHSDNLVSELETIKALFNEKEKELATAVAKVEELTSQLAQLRNGQLTSAVNGSTTCHTSLSGELEKLRNELSVRNKLNEQQSSKLSNRQQSLAERRDEIAKMDARIAELQNRLKKKKAGTAPPSMMHNGTGSGGGVSHQMTCIDPATQKRVWCASPNVAAVEPLKRNVSAENAGTFAKADPKYQTLPAKLKFAERPPAKTNDVLFIYKGGESRATATEPCGSGHPTSKPSSPPMQDHTTSKPAVTGSVVSPKAAFLATDTSPRAAFMSNSTDVSPKMACASSSCNTSAAINVSTFSSKVAAPRATYNMSNFAPRPFGSSYSSGLPTRSVAMTTTVGLPASMTTAVSTPIAVTTVNHPVAMTTVSQSAPSTFVATSMPGYHHFPKTSTPRPGRGDSSEREIFITEAPVSPLSNLVPASSQNAKTTGPIYQLATSRVQATSAPLHAGKVSPSNVPVSPSKPALLSTTPRVTKSALSPTEVTKTVAISAGTNVTSSLSKSLVTPSLKTSVVSTALSTISKSTPMSVAPTTSVAKAVPTTIVSSTVAKTVPTTTHSKPTTPTTSVMHTTTSTTTPVVASTTTTTTTTTATTTTPVTTSTTNSSLVTSSIKVTLSDSSSSSKAEERPAGQDQTDNINDNAVTVPKSKLRALVESTRPTSDITQKDDDAKKSAMSVSSALSVLMSSSSTATADSKPAYRYAPKSVIANTYTRRLGSNAVDHYRRNMSQLYRGFLAPNFDDGNTEANDAVDDAAKRPFGSGPPPYAVATAGKGNELGARASSPRDIATDLNNSVDMDDGEPLEGSPPRTVHINHMRELSHHHHNKTTADGIPFADSEAGKENVVPAPAGPHVPNALRHRKGNLKTKGSLKSSNRVSFDPLALLLDASLEGELELVKSTAKQVTDPSASNDEGITALHNAICAGHFEIVRFLVTYGCNVNSPDSDGWTPLHCAASCNNLPMVRFLVEHGACIFATTISDHETAAEKCEEEEDGFEGCSEYLYSIQEKLGILNKGCVYAVFDYTAHNDDELSFVIGDTLTVLRKGDDHEKEWWWAMKKKKKEGYIPRNLLGLHPRVVPEWLKNKPTS